MYKNKHCQ